jgi:hypothetical protein
MLIILITIIPTLYFALGYIPFSIEAMDLYLEQAATQVPCILSIYADVVGLASFVLRHRWFSANYVLPNLGHPICKCLGGTDKTKVTTNKSRLLVHSADQAAKAV